MGFAVKLPRRRVLQAGGMAGLSLPVWLSGCATTAPTPPAELPATRPAVRMTTPKPMPMPMPVPPAATVSAPDPYAGDNPPPEPREFRAAWVATVANIDWPSRPGLSAAVMQREALAILDRAQTLGLNALILQVRPACDAIFPSTLEPWTEFLSGEQGRAPWAAGEAPWDPLAFWVAEAHRRAIELHAWFNPYRARHSTAKSPIVTDHIARRRPELVAQVGDQLWLDPGQPDSAAHTLAVVADVVRRYDIDAVHIDDYFYPYPVKVGGVDQPFPDDVAWTRYKLDGGPIGSRDDWRRAQVDTLVQALHRTVQSIKPWVRFGISPFGLPRPDRRPPGVVGFSQYDQLYADVERWVENGWLDYLAPQLYWPIARAGQPFAVLLDLWLAANPMQRHIWPGLFTSRVINTARGGEVLGTNVWPGQELIDQVAVQRSRSKSGFSNGQGSSPDASTGNAMGANGHIHFSMVALMQDRDKLATRLQASAYAEPALVPATPWLPDALPSVLSAAPLLQASGKQVLLRPSAGAVPRHWAVWLRREKRWHLQVLPGSRTALDIQGADRVVASAINRVGQAGPRAMLRLVPTS